MAGRREGRPEALALRCAPVQVNWLGYAGTSGHPKLADYLLGDPIVTPAAHAAHYTETLAQLPNCYLPADDTILPGPPPSRREAGLPEEGFVFCSFNNSYKFNPQVFDLWCRLLRETDSSCLWLSQPGGPAQERLRSEAQARGVDPARLVFAPRVSRGWNICRACNWRISPSTRFRTTHIRRGSMSCGRACRWSRCSARPFRAGWAPACCTPSASMS
jgi:protein O-GlcNAc transferase